MLVFSACRAKKIASVVLLAGGCLVAGSISCWAADQCDTQLNNSAQQSQADYMNNVNGCTLNANCKQNGHSRVVDTAKEFKEPNEAVANSDTAATSDYTGTLAPFLQPQVDSELNEKPNDFQQAVNQGGDQSEQKNEGNKVVKPGNPQNGTCPQNAIAQSDYRTGA